MRRTCLAAALVVAALPVTALAHGGGPFRGPPGPPPPGVSEPWSSGWEPPPIRLGEGPVAGRVLDGEGEPLAGAWIWCEGGAVAQTGDDGRFRCRPRHYPADVVVTAAEHAARLLVAAARPAPGAHLDLGDALLPAVGKISGTVPDDVDTNLDVRIRIVPEGTRVPEAFARAGVYTGWNGVAVRRGRGFVFRGLPAGSYRVIASHGFGDEVVVADGLRPGAPPLEIPLARLPEEPLPGCEDGDGVLRVSGPGGTSVTILDRARRILVDGAVLDDSGPVEIAVPAGATLDVIARQADLVGQAVEGVVAGQHVTIPPAPTGTTVSGRVVRSDGTPVRDAIVRVTAAVDTIHAAERRVQTDAEGAFTVEGVCAGLRVVASAPGLSNAERPCLVVAGADDVLVIVDEERVDRIPHLRDFARDR